MQHMKALELKVYPNAERCSLWPAWCSVEFHDLVGPAKRLTDAELAAEFHAANSDAWRAHSVKGSTLGLLEDRFQTLHRFATLPHYDDPTETGNKR